MTRTPSDSEQLADEIGDAEAKAHLRQVASARAAAELSPDEMALLAAWCEGKLEEDQAAPIERRLAATLIGRQLYDRGKTLIRGAR